jgi:hypothetical protein
MCFSEFILPIPIHFTGEIILGTSIILRFFHKQQDPETLEILGTYKQIAKFYIMRSWFVIDVFSLIPWELFSENTAFLKLIRLVRLPKLFQLLDMNRFDRIIDSLFSKSRNDKLIIMYNLRFFFKIFRLIIVAVTITYFIGCVWYVFCVSMAESNEFNFIEAWGLDKEEITQPHKLILSCYYVLTTLTTIGYGDLYPVNNSERIFAIFIMLLGVAMFSYVMGSFTDLISSYDKKLGIIDQNADLQNWLTMLTKFNKHKPLSTELIYKIDKHFSYFWQNDRNSSISKKDPYISSLPKKLKLKLMEYLWGDILLKFSNFFLFFGSNKEKFFKFYYDLSFCFMPRRYLPGEYLYKPDEEVEEMYLMEEGYVDIGVTFDGNLNNAKYLKTISSPEYFGEIYCLFNIKSKYAYKAASEVSAFGINKQDLLKAIEKYDELYIKYRTKAYRKYNEYIKTPIEKRIQEEIQHGHIQPGLNYTENMPNPQQAHSINSLIKNRIKQKNQEVHEALKDIEKRFIKLDDDYGNVSRLLFTTSLECEKDIIRMNSELDEVQNKINSIVQSHNN